MRCCFGVATTLRRRTVCFPPTPSSYTSNTNCAPGSARLGHQPSESHWSPSIRLRKWRFVSWPKYATTAGAASAVDSGGTRACRTASMRSDPRLRAVTPFAPASLKGTSRSDISSTTSSSLSPQPASRPSQNCIWKISAKAEATPRGPPTARHVTFGFRTRGRSWSEHLSGTAPGVSAHASSVQQFVLYCTRFSCRRYTRSHDAGIGTLEILPLKPSSTPRSSGLGGRQPRSASQASGPSRKTRRRRLCVAPWFTATLQPLGSRMGLAKASAESMSRALSGSAYMAKRSHGTPLRKSA
mmetsp:Transcript_35504/g.99736  ORF Transcript_35504/g.99736 Transcript_35504/m.99736 type:complete len:298 (+) Transcript_35504:292-1185(+)